MIPASGAIEFVDLAHEIYNRVFRKVPVRLMKSEENMTDAEKIILIQTIAEEVEDIVKGKATSSFAAIQKRLRRFTEQYENNKPKE